jgi:hypothetical protein
MLSSRIAEAKRRKLTQQISDASAVTTVSSLAHDARGIGRLSDDDGDVAAAHTGSSGSQGECPYMVGRLLGLASSVPAPALPMATQWWTRPMFNAIAPRWDSLHGRRRRPLTIAEVCAGLGSAHRVCKCLGLDFRCVAACDVKEASRKWLDANDSAEHVYKSMANYSASRGCGGSFCTRHGIDCPSDDVDLLIGGPPCQPYSSFHSAQERAQSGRGCLDHVSVKATLGGTDDPDSFPGVLNVVRPRSWVFENVEGFAKLDKKAKLCPLAVFMKAIASILNSDGEPYYPYVHLFSLEPKPWSDIHRARTAPLPSICMLAQGFLGPPSFVFV